MSLAILFHFLCAQHVSNINISIIMSLLLFCWITTLLVLFLVRCVLEFRCGWFGVVSVLQAAACNTDTFRPDPVRKMSARIPLLCVESKTPDDGQRNCPKHVEFYSKNKFEELVHLIGVIIRIYHDARSAKCHTSPYCPSGCGNIDRSFIVASCALVMNTCTLAPDFRSPLVRSCISYLN